MPVTTSTISEPGITPPVRELPEGDTIQPNAGGTTGYNAYQYANGNTTTYSGPIDS